MKKLIHKSGTRGQANYGWLQTRYSFSFANYYNPDRVHFGALRVFNDDFIAGGEGFGMHPHDNMEIVTIILDGELEHKDNMGHTTVLKKDEVQVMTAGTGIMHSEFNHSVNEPLKLFQIWVFPEERDLTPRYDQRAFSPEHRNNQWQTLVSPNANNGLLVNQKTWFSRGNFKAGSTIVYNLNKADSGVYVFVIEGIARVADEQLENRDAIGIWETDSVEIITRSDADILVIEAPMMK